MTNSTEKKTKAEQAAEQLEAAIVSCQLAPGTVMTETELSEYLEIGRTPVREALTKLANEHLVVFRERDNRRRRAIAFAVFDDLGRIAFHHCYAGVGGTQVDTDNFTHDFLLQNLVEIRKTGC